MTISDRLNLVLRKKELSQKDFSDKINYPPKNLSNFIRGFVKLPKIDLVVGIAKYFPELNLQWLLLGEGEMWNNQKRENEHPISSNLEVLQNKVESLERENQLLREMNELLKQKNK